MFIVVTITAFENIENMMLVLKDFWINIDEKFSGKFENVIKLLRSVNKDLRLVSESM